MENLIILKDGKMHIAKYLPGVYAVRVFCGATVPNRNVDEFHYATCEPCREAYRQEFGDDVLTEAEYRAGENKLRQMIEDELYKKGKLDFD